MKTTTPKTAGKRPKNAENDPKTAGKSRFHDAGAKAQPQPPLPELAETLHEDGKLWDLFARLLLIPGTVRSGKNHEKSVTNERGEVLPSFFSRGETQNFPRGGRWEGMTKKILKRRKISASPSS